MNKRKLFLFLSAIIIYVICVAQASQYAKRLFPTFSDPASPCTRGSVWFQMVTNKALICTNNGIEEIAVGAAGGVIPIANSTTTGRLSSTDWVAFNSKQAALGYTPENLANKNASSGYAGLSGGKISSTQMTEVLSALDLSDYSSSSGTGSTSIRSTINSASTNDVLTWNGTNWVNQAPIVFSVFGRNGIVTAQTGDYTAAQVTNAFNLAISNVLTNVVAPGSPSAGSLAIWADNTDTILKVKNSSGTIAVTVRPNTCSGTDKISSITSAGLVVCSADQNSGGGGGISTLNTLTGTTQTFSDVDDTNVTLAISSVGINHAFTIGWTGTLADSRVADIISLTQVPNLTSNGFIKTSGGNGTLSIDTNTYLTSAAPTDATYITQTSNATLSAEQALSALATGIVKNTTTTGVLSIAVAGTDYLIPTGNGSALTGIVFSQIGGSVTDAQVPNNITIDLATVATTANAGDSATAFFPSGTIEVARLGTGSPSGSNFLRGDGTWAVPSGSGDMILASVQTVTGAKTFDPAKLIVGSVSSDPAVVIGAFYRDLDNGKLYFGVDDTVDFWGEVFIGGQSLVNLVSGVTGTLPVANGGTGITSFGTGVATWLGTPSSANLRAALTDENGTGVALFNGATSPDFTTSITIGSVVVPTISSTSTLTNKTLVNPAITVFALTDGATINWDTNSGNISIVTLGGNRTMAAPTNIKTGGSYSLTVTQDGTGSRTITWNSVFKWPGGTAPTLTTTAAAKDLITCISNDGTNLLCNALLDVK